MNNERTFALFQDTGPSAGTAVESPDGGAQGVDPKIAAARNYLEQVRIRAMSQQDADRTLRELSRIQSISASLMYDVTDMVAATNTETDAAEVLRQGARMPTRESKKMTKIAKQLSEMPKVKEKLATGEITPGSCQRSGQRGGEGRSRSCRRRRDAAGSGRPDASRHVRQPRPEMVRPETDRPRSSTRSSVSAGRVKPRCGSRRTAASAC